MVNDASASSGNSSPLQAVNSVYKRSLRRRFMYFFYFHIFSFFSSFQRWFYQMRWFYPYCSFKHRKWWRHKL